MKFKNFFKDNTNTLISCLGAFLCIFFISYFNSIDEDIVREIFKKGFENNADKIFHNASYDIGWLKRWGIDVKGRIIDTMVAAALIDENRMPGQYNLNAAGFEIWCDPRIRVGHEKTRVI